MCKLIFLHRFGFNNPILQVPENFLKNPQLVEKRKKMVEEFHNIMFTSLKKRDQLSEEQNKKNKKTPHKAEE